MDHLSSYGNRIVSGAPVSASDFGTPASSVEALANKPQGRLLPWLVMAAVITFLVGGGWGVFKAFKYVEENIGTWQEQLRTRNLDNDPLAGNLPPIKKDLYGTLAGLKIVGIEPNTTAARVGLKYGDILVAYNKRPVSNEDEID
ncbi:MAG: hypothetical protein ABJB61_14255, partial [bacterium]